MWPNQQDFSAIPVSQGKTKALWDAIRKAGVSADGGPLPPDDTDGKTDMSASAAPVGPANPLPPRPVPQAGPPSIDTPAGPVAAPPPAPLPTDSRVTDLQSQVDASRQKPSLIQNLKKALPSLLVSGIGAAFGQGGAGFQGMAAGQKTGIEEGDKRRAALTQELDSATRSRSEEYSAQQRAQELSNAARIAAGSREAVAGTNKEAKLGVADIQGDTRRDVVGTQGETARDVADTRADASRYGADQGVVKGKYAADAAANRQTRSIDAAASRQSRSLTHAEAMQGDRQQFSLDKPTATEDNRADYQKSLKENLDRMRDVATRRPELFGKPSLLHPTHGGLASGIKTAIGTDDQDLATFTQASHNLGILMNSTHGIRSANAVPAAAHSVTNGMKNSPEAFKAAADALEASGNTMKTIVRPTFTPINSSTKGKKPLVKGKAADNDPLGIR